MNIVSKGNEVQIFYVGKLKDGSVFDSTEGRSPFKFIAGSENVLPGISNGVIGMKVGDKKIIEISSDNAYGQYNKELVVKLPRKNVPEKTQVGDVLTDSNQNHWFVKQIDNDFVILDGNHPLAGQDLIFEIELIAIS